MGTTGSTVIAVEKSDLKLPKNFRESTDALILPCSLIKVDLEKNTYSKDMETGFLEIRKSNIDSTPNQVMFDEDSYTLIDVTSCMFYSINKKKEASEKLTSQIRTNIRIALNTFEKYESAFNTFLNSIPSKTERYKFCTRCNRRRSQ